MRTLVRASVLLSILGGVHAGFSKCGDAALRSAMFARRYFGSLRSNEFVLKPRSSSAAPE